MTRFITFFVILGLTSTAFADLKSAAQSIEKMKVRSNAGETWLNVNFVDGKTTKDVEFGPFLSEKMDIDGLEDISVKTFAFLDDSSNRQELYKKVRSSLGTYPGYYCDFLFPENQSFTAEQCADLTVKIARIMAHADADVIKVVVIEGDYYGNYYEVVLYAWDYKNKDMLEVSLDVLHEI